MKKQLFWTCIVALLFNLFDVSAQVQGNRQPFGNDFWEKRNAFIVADCGLSPDEAAKFIPLENEFRQKVFDIGRDCRTLARESREKTKQSDVEYLKLIDCYLDNRIKEAQLEKEYFEKFKKILKPEKLYKYREADAKFSRELINNVRRPNTPQERTNTNRPPDRDNTNRPTERGNQNRQGNQR